MIKWSIPMVVLACAVLRESSPAPVSQAQVVRRARHHHHGAAVVGPSSASFRSSAGRASTIEVCRSSGRAGRSSGISRSSEVVSPGRAWGTGPGRFSSQGSSPRGLPALSPLESWPRPSSRSPSGKRPRRPLPSCREWWAWRPQGGMAAEYGPATLTARPGGARGPEAPEPPFQQPSGRGTGAGPAG